jgi:hypothetical protein
MKENLAVFALILAILSFVDGAHLKSKDFLVSKDADRRKLNLK